GGTTLSLTPYADTWAWLLGGSVPYIFFIVIQLGLLGAVWLFYNLFTVMLPPSPMPLGRNIKIFVWLILALMMFYNDSLRFFPFCAIIFYIILFGYVNVSEKHAKI
ncbi:MAG: hypothetical protein K2H08_06720, partial [Duncaniella sp.]|nr:hypothetical protein [Duncaniella sp.]